MLVLPAEIQNTVKGLDLGACHLGLCSDMLSMKQRWSRQLRHKAQRGGLKRNV